MLGEGWSLGVFSRGLFLKGWLIWKLLRDPRVPVWLKLIAPIVLIYFLLPTDLISDFVPIAGRIDDLLAIGIGAYLFVRLIPRTLVENLLRSREAHNQNSNPEGVIDGSYRVL